MIILDEATAYADPENEYLIQSAISKLVKRKKTLIVVAHRLATIQNADQILVVEKWKDCRLRQTERASVKNARFIKGYGEIM